MQSTMMNVLGMWTVIICIISRIRYNNPGQVQGLMNILYIPVFQPQEHMIYGSIMVPSENGLISICAGSQ